MQSPLFLFAAALLLIPFAAVAETPSGLNVITPDMQLHTSQNGADGYIGTSSQEDRTQGRDAKKMRATQAQRNDSSGTERPYVTPVGAYNNNGWFGD